MIIILPVKDEEKNIDQIVRGFDLYKQKESYKIVFVDDGSIDNTAKIIKSHNRKDIIYIKNSFDKGKGSALKTAYILATHGKKISDDELFVFLDGDGQIDFKNINILLNTMDLYCADVVVGSKRHIYSHSTYSFTRNIISRTYNLMIRIMFGLNYADTQCGLKMFRKYAIDSVIDKINVKRYAFDLELFVALKAKGYIIADAPIRLKPQTNKGSVSIQSILITFADTIAIFCRKMTGYYK